MKNYKYLEISFFVILIAIILIFSFLIYVKKNEIKTDCTRLCDSLMDMKFYYYQGNYYCISKSGYYLPIEINAETNKCFVVMKDFKGKINNSL